MGKLLSNKISEGLFDPKKLIENDKVFFSKDKLDNNLPKYITLYNYPFLILTHNIIDWSDEFDDNDNKYKLSRMLPSNPKLWREKNIDGSDIISMSFNSKYMLSTFSDGIVTLGFSKIKDNQIVGVGVDDMGISSKEEVSYGYVGKSKLLSEKEKVIGGYNEVVVERKGVFPDYLLVTNKMTNTGLPILNKETKLWAEFYKIPIVILDVDSYLKGAINDYEKMFNFLKEQEYEISKKQLENLDRFRRCIDTYDYEEIYSISESKMMMDLFDNNNYKKRE